EFLLYGLVFSFFLNLFTVLVGVVINVIEVTSIRGSDFTIIEGLVVSWNLFMNDSFYNLVNPSYVSLYILLVLGYYLKKELDSIWRVLTVLILFAYLFLLANEAAYFTLFIMAVLLVWHIKDRGKRYLLVFTLIL